MKKITTIYFRKPISFDPRGFLVGKEIIHEEMVEKVDTQNNSIILSQECVPQTGGEICRITKPKEGLCTFIHLSQILKIETTWEEKQPSPK